MRILLTLTALLFSFTFALEPFNTVAGPFSIIRISDGDNVELETLGRIRLIGIDTPEKFEGDKLDRDAERLGIPREDIQAMGRSASAYTEGLLEGELVFVELDVEGRDQYGRVLGYLYILDDNGVWEFEGRTFTQVNLELVIAGWAEPFTFPPNVAYADLYVEAARVAREINLGLWALNSPQMVENAGVLIECILYNPDGRDEGNEQVTLYASDVDDVFDYAKDTEWQQYLPVPSPYTREDAQEFINMQLEADAVSLSHWAITVDDTVIGTIGIRFFEQYDFRVGELGYSLKRSEWGKGFITEAARAVLDHAFRTYPHLLRMEASADSRNAASLRVMEKIGMKREGVLRSRFFVRGELGDEVYYSMLKSEWLRKTY